MNNNDEPIIANDRAFELLRASDPAAGSPDPDLSWVRAHVMAQITGKESQHLQRQWWRTPMKVAPAAIAASCALMLSAGGLGYSLGAGKGPEVVAMEDIAKSPEPLIDRRAEGGSAGRSDAAGFMWGEWGQGRVEYLKGWSGAPKFAAEAEAYYYAPMADAEVEKRLRNLAAALGLKGEIVKTDFGDWVMENPGSEYEYFSFGGGALGNFYYSNDSAWQTCPPVEATPGDDNLPLPVPEPAIPQLRNGAGGAAESAAEDYSPGVEPGRVCEPSPTDFNATPEGATVTAQGLLASAGLPIADFSWTTEDAPWESGYGAQEVWVTATPRTEDIEARWTFQFVTDDKPVSVSGSLATLSPLGMYPLVTADEALQRLNDPRFGPMAGSFAYSKPTIRVAEAEDGQSAPDAPVSDRDNLATTPSPLPLSPGSPIWWPVQTVTVSSISLGLGRHYVGMEIVIVPAYVMTTSDGGEVRVLAVADTALNTAPE